MNFFSLFFKYFLLGFSMEKIDSNHPFKVQVSLNSKYQSLIVRGRLIHEQTPKSTFAEKRK